MTNPIAIVLKTLDRLSEAAARHTAQTHGRRSFLAKISVAMMGGALLPMLPFDRAFGTESSAGEHSDPSTCDYWAYCSLNGVRCNACGGSLTQCPAGTQASKVAWVGTCTNPKDKKNYLVSYADCCGQSACGEDAMCSRHEADRPGYRIGAFNEMNWCMANANKGVSCSTAVVMSIADSE